jgi:uncharacterized membrane protein
MARHRQRTCQHAGLTFQLAADIIDTSITTSWQTIGRVAAVALIRTFCAAVPPQLPPRPQGP